MSDEKYKIVRSIKIKPSHDFVVVRVDPEENLEVTSGGIITPPTVVQNKKTQTGVVVEVGPGRCNNDTGKRIPMQCEVGQRVIFAQFIGYPVVLGRDGTHVVIKDYDVMGLIEEDSELVDEINPTEFQSDADVLEGKTPEGKTPESRLVTPRRCGTW